MQHKRLAHVAVAGSAAIGLAVVVLNWSDLNHPLSGTWPGTLTELIADPPVVGTLRIGLVFLFSYIVGSVLGLALEGRVLVKAGPTGAEVESAGATDALELSNREFEDRLLDLEESLDQAWDAINRLELDIDEEGEE